MNRIKKVLLTVKDFEEVMLERYAEQGTFKAYANKGFYIMCLDEEEEIAFISEGEELNVINIGLNPSDPMPIQIIVVKTQENYWVHRSMIEEGVICIYEDIVPTVDNQFLDSL